MLVATPGRLLDHLDARVANLRAVEFLVLDEVDQMLDLGFIKPIRRIVRDLPKKRQNLFFSATMPTEIRALAGELLRDPVEVAVTPVAKTADRVEQSVIFVDAAKKRDMLVELFEDPELTRTIVFTRTKRGADRVAQTLEEAGDRRRRDPRQQEPGPARARASPRSAAARPARWSRPTSPRAASTSTASATSSISSCRKSPRPTSTASAAPRAPARRARRSRSATARSANSLRAIERLTRLRILSIDRRGERGPKPAPVVRKAAATPAPDRPHHSPHRDPRSANQQPHRARQGRRARPAFAAESTPAR